MALSTFDGVKFVPKQDKPSVEEIFAAVGKRFLIQTRYGEVIAADVDSLSVLEKARLIPFMKVISD